MSRGEKEKVMKKEDLVNYAVLHAVGVLRDAAGLDMSPEQLFNYRDKNRIDSKVREIEESSEFKKLRGEEKWEFFYKEIGEYVLEHKPFDKGGEKLLKESLENIVESSTGFLDVFFPKRKDKRNKKAVRDYLESRKIAGDISYAVARNPENYQGEKGKELIEAINESNKYSGKGVLAEILYAGGRLAKDTYQNIKSGIRDSSKRIVELARKYVESPATNYATAALGILLIFLFNPITSTGSVVGPGNLENNSFLPFVGIALLFISGLSFIFRGRKLKK